MRRRAEVVLMATIAASLVIRLLVWFRRDFNHDDFFLAYMSWVRSTPARPNVDFIVPNFTPLAELLSPLFGWFPQSFIPLHLGRAIILVTMAALLALPVLLARAAGASREWSLLPAAVITFDADFIRRIGDIRADGISTALLLTAAWLIMREQRWRNEIIAAIAYGAAVALSYKFLLALPFVVTGLVLVRREQWVRRVIAFVTIAALPGVLYLTWRVAADGLPIVRSIIAIVLSSRHFPSSTSHFWMLRSLSQNIVVYAAIVAGAIGVVAARRERPPAFGYALLSFGFAAAYIAVNPLIFPYAAVVLIPLVAPVAAGIERLLRDRVRAEAAALIALPLALALESLPATADTIVRTNEAQKRVVRWIWSATPPGTRAFDWQGMHFGRFGILDWYHPDLHQAEYARGQWRSMQREWRAAGVALIIENYRLLELNAADAAFLSDHYVKFDRCLLVPGRLFRPDDWRDGAASFDAVASGPYRVVPAISGLTVDGVPAGPVVTLSAGEHRLSLNGPPPARLFLLYWAYARNLPLPCPADEPLLYGFD